MERDCWSGGKGPGKGKGKFGGKTGKAGPGKGKGKGKNKKGYTCHICGSPDHLQMMCPKRMQANLIEGYTEQEWAEYEAQEGYDTQEGYDGQEGYSVELLHGAYTETYDAPQDQHQTQRFVSALEPLQQVNNVGAQSQDVIFGVDSGSWVTVITPGEAQWFPLDDSVKETYRAANKQPVTMMGKRILETENNTLMRVAVGDVSRNLLALADLEDSGHRIVFDGDTGGRYAVHRETGEIMQITRVGRAYEAKIKVKMAPTVKGQSIGRAGPQANHINGKGKGNFKGKSGGKGQRPLPLSGTARMGW